MSEKQIKRKIKKMGGQVVLMVLLASALVLTLGLSASKQATVETKIETDQELLKKAFNAAESGIEYYLGTGNVDYSGGENGGTADLSVRSVGGSDVLIFGNTTLNGGLDYFWLVGHNTDGSLASDYYSSGSSSIQVCAVSGEPTSFKLAYYYIDGVGDYKVENVEETVSDSCVSKSLTGNSLLLSVMPVGDDAKVKVSGSSNFPSQGEEIVSTGIVEGVNNTVTVTNKYVVMDLLLEAVSSGGSISN